MIIGRSSRLTHFLEWREYKIVFKRYNMIDPIDMSNTNSFFLTLPVEIRAIDRLDIDD